MIEFCNALILVIEEYIHSYSCMPLLLQTFIKFALFWNRWLYLYFIGDTRSCNISFSAILLFVDKEPIVQYLFLEMNNVGHIRTQFTIDKLSNFGNFYSSSLISWQNSTNFLNSSLLRMWSYIEKWKVYAIACMCGINKVPIHFDEARNIEMHCTYF